MSGICDGRVVIVTGAGRVFGVAGGRITVAEGSHGGPRAEQTGRWDPAELGAVVPDLVAQAAPNADVLGQIPTGGK